jgi:hypothetical protein
MNKLEPWQSELDLNEADFGKLMQMSKLLMQSWPPEKNGLRIVEYNPALD